MRKMKDQLQVSYMVNLVIEVKKNNTVGSYIVGVDKINYRASKTKIDALKLIMN